MTKVKSELFPGFFEVSANDVKRRFFKCQIFRVNRFEIAKKLGNVV